MIKRVANGTGGALDAWLPHPIWVRAMVYHQNWATLRWRKSTQRFSAQSKDCLLDARYLLCVISLVLAASPAVPRRLLEHRVSCNPTSGCIPVYTNQRTHDSWKLATKRLPNFIQICRSAWIVHSFRLVRATSLLGSLPPIGPSPLRIPRRPAIVISAYVSSLVVMV